MVNTETKPQKVSILDLQNKKSARQPITMLTAYDYPSACLVDESGADIILVGDSVAMTVLGYPNTVSITMDEMLHHCKAVARGAKRSLLVGDMPFLSYQVDQTEAIRNAGRFLKEADMDAIKIEGGREIVETARAIGNAGIAVMGHLGLTPQSATKLGGYKVQGKSAASAARLLEDALSLQEVGCFAIVLEAIPEQVAEIISHKLDIPTIGIGAGARCDGQVLVFHDLLGLFQEFKPKFVKQYANLYPVILRALQTFCREVQDGTFPTEEHSYKIDENEFGRFIEGIS